MTRKNPTQPPQPRARSAMSDAAQKSKPQRGKSSPDKTVSVTFGMSRKERVADDESARPIISSSMPALERVAAVHLDIRSRRWTLQRKAEAASVSVGEFREIINDPLLAPTLEEAWRHLLMGIVGAGLHGMAESVVLVGREGASDRTNLFRMAGMLQAPGRGHEAPSSPILQASAVRSRLEAARAGRALPAPGVEAAAVPEAIDADYVEEPSEQEAGDTSEFV